MIAYFFSFLSFIAILFGGFFAIRFQRFQEKIASLAIGIMLGTVFMEILPDIALAKTEIFMLLGFLIFYFLQHFARWHEHSHSHHVGHAGAVGMILHSFLDGLSMGVGFLVSPETGFLIATAILIHGFNDGLTTVTVLIKEEEEHGHLIPWLLANALAPMLGVTLSLFAVAIPGKTLPTALAFAGGFILYLASSDLLPEVREKSKWLNFILTLFGVVLVGLLINLVKI